MPAVRAVQPNNYHCVHDKSERVSSNGAGSRLEKLLKTNFIINTFQDFRSHLQKNYILEQVFTERLFFVEHISATVFHKIVFITPLLFSLIKLLSYFIYSGQLEFLYNSSSVLFCNDFTRSTAIFHVGYRTLHQTGFCSKQFFSHRNKIVVLLFRAYQTRTAFCKNPITTRLP